MPDNPPGERQARRAPAVVVAAVAAAALSIATATWAAASFLDGGAATSTFSTDTLAPPSNLSSGLCLVGAVTLSWTATPSSWADGYEIRWGTTSGGPYSVGSTTSLLTTKTVTGLSLFTTYHFVVRAYDGSWRSVDTTQRTVAC